MAIQSNPEWNEKDPQEKKLTIAGVIVSLVVLVLAALQMTGTVENTSVIFVPLMGLFMLIQAMQAWKYRRGVAIACIVVSVFLFACGILFAVAS